MRVELGCCLMLVAAPLHAQARGDLEPARNSAAAQLSEDPYTRYELLEPGSGKFRILYKVTAHDAGARFYWSPIRRGSIASDERVTDLATGKPLQFSLVDGKAAGAAGFKNADQAGEYLQVTLARPVPADGGEGRILIDKTYEDRKSYYTDGDLIVFERPLGINRNSVVLPAGYQLVSCNVPSQVLQQPDGRTMISFWNASPAQAPLVLKARKITLASASESSVPRRRLQERASQAREIVYLLRQPETHSFDLYHDYTEERPGVSTYVNVVRTGSKVSNPSGRNLDTGATLTSRIVHGAEVAEAAPEEKDVTPTTEAFVHRAARL